MSVDKSPVYNVKAVPIEKIQANDYNPNVVAPPEMKLRPGERQLYFGRRIPPLSGVENFQTDLSTRERFVAGRCD